MLRGRSFVLFIVSLTLGLGTAWMAYRWLQSRETPGVAAADTTPVLVAALEIPFGKKIEAAHLKTVTWPTGNVPPGSFREAAQVEGKIANGTIIANEPVLAGRVVDHLAGSTLSAMIAPSKRAVTVRVNDVVGVAGFLLPGNRVDVIASRKKENRRTVTSTILQNLKVLAVDQTASPDKNQPVVVRAVTLETDPRQAETLVKATDEGAVQLILRNPADASRLAAAERPMKKLAPPPVYTPVVTVIRGTDVEEAQVKL